MTVEDLEFEAWYRAAHPRLGAALTVAFGDVDLAQDAADEAVTLAFQNWGRIQKMESPTGWLYRTGFNVARRRRPRAALERKLLRRSAPEPSTPPRETELWFVVADLPDRQREAVVLRHVGQLREREVAEVMGLTRGGVSSTLRAAYASLRVDISESEPFQEVP